MKRIFVTTLLCVTVSYRLFAQQYTAAEFSITNPCCIIIENYTRVNIVNEATDDVMANRFNVNNPYTYLQIINDAAGNIYHVLLQTDFMGKILYLSYSNNLSAIFNKKDKPMFLFQHCLKDMNNHISSVQVMDAAVKCVLDRLNYCSDN